DPLEVAVGDFTQARSANEPVAARYAQSHPFREVQVHLCRRFGHEKSVCLRLFVVVVLVIVVDGGFPYERETAGADERSDRGCDRASLAHDVIAQHGSTVSKPENRAVPVQEVRTWNFAREAVPCASDGEAVAQQESSLPAHQEAGLAIEGGSLNRNPSVPADVDSVGIVVEEGSGAVVARFFLFLTGLPRQLERRRRSFGPGFPGRR